MKKLNGVGYFILSNALKTRLRQMEARLRAFRSDVLRQLQDIEDDGIQYTDWYVLLKFNKANNKWQSACYYPDDDEDGTKCPIDDFEICLPIPKPETLKEFEGF